MDAAFQIRKKLLDAKCDLLAIKADLAFDRFLRAAVKAGFNEDQPRDASRLSIKPRIALLKRSASFPKP